MRKIKNIPLDLKDGSKIYIEAVKIGNCDEEEIGIEQYKFESVTKKITVLSNEIIDSVKTTGLNKISVKFGIEIGVESGGLSALIVKGTGKANIEVTLEWNKQG